VSLSNISEAISSDITFYFDEAPMDLVTDPEFSSSAFSSSWFSSSYAAIEI
jgi:hypothetical protein